MPFLEHLERLRWRIIGSVAALGGGVGLFAMGALFAYLVMLPMSLPWLFALFGTALEPMISAENDFGFVFDMVLSFGLAFELPVVVLLLAATATALRANVELDVHVAPVSRLRKVMRFAQLGTQRVERWSEQEHVARTFDQPYSVVRLDALVAQMV